MTYMTIIPLRDKYYSLGSRLVIIKVFAVLDFSAEKKKVVKNL